ncbi:hypothetical protein B0H66DRAFT_296101 [Apodospora peruviana]|uniref:Uncharacterized protein n=1 Tax=Apodospora peruviana TaxID=516989 RepID=A0AAE0I2K9_9PEZI|nr:hypothetical protein B0H66DRAFT_296101 [Apodospora peruviana]
MIHLCQFDRIFLPQLSAFDRSPSVLLLPVQLIREQEIPTWSGNLSKILLIFNMEKETGIQERDGHTHNTHMDWEQTARPQRHFPRSSSSIRTHAYWSTSFLKLQVLSPSMTVTPPADSARISASASPPASIQLIRLSAHQSLFLARCVYVITSICGRSSRLGPSSSFPPALFLLASFYLRQGRNLEPIDHEVSGVPRLGKIFLSPTRHSRAIPACP